MMKSVIVQEPGRTATPNKTAGPTIRDIRRKITAGHYGAGVRIMSLVITLLAWEVYGRQVDPVFLSYPTAIAAAVPAMLASGELGRALVSSLQGLLVGLALAVFFGTALGLLMGRYRLVDQMFDLQISALYATPNVALVPLVILWFGLGLAAKIFIIFLAAFFPVVVNTYAGVRNVSRGLVEVALAEGANEAQVFSKIVIPASLPFITVGVRLATGRAVVGMVVAELFTAVSGLGGAIVTYGNAFATDKLFVVIILLALIGLCLNEMVKMFDKWILPWKETERAS
jgi:ABC-type nitrate/sulfonate/bicarbonate transport system permease component